MSGATASLNSSTDVLTIREGGSKPQDYTLQLTGNYSGETFHVSADAGGGTMVTLSAARAVTADPALVRELGLGGYGMERVPEAGSALARPAYCRVGDGGGTGAGNRIRAPGAARALMQDAPTVATACGKKFFGAFFQKKAPLRNERPPRRPHPT